ncbi:MAG: chemotaxis-specific protein-glutamate methyltransferase CheB [Marivivens sp.]|nr:chemotaxis-specific protein-glutamate methyltransferase CheB [Marivivens sp.]
MTQRKPHVLIVDDSRMIQHVLGSGLRKSGEFASVRTAEDPEAALYAIREQRPDVITLDLEMPKMDGLTFLKRHLKPMQIPTVVISSATAGNRTITIRSMDAGAVDIIAKPELTPGTGLMNMMSEVVGRIKAAAGATTRDYDEDRPLPSQALPKMSANMLARHMIAIGASTGGVQALNHILPSFGKDAPGIVVVQHMPQGFTASFAARLNRHSEAEVIEARDGDEVLPGRIIIAPGGEKHLIVQREGWRSVVRLVDGDLVSYSRPSVDVMFQSAAQTFGRHCIGVLLTGMGRDGADGLLNIRNSGGRTFAQDKRTCTVFGMPAAAEKIGAVERMCSLDEIPGRVMHALQSGRSKIPV